MSIITISRGSYSKGKEIAEKVAQRLNYECISRDILIEASKDFNIDEIKLIRAIHDAPSFFDKLSIKKEQYISYIQTAILKHFQKDNVVYHGLAGHFFVAGVAHALKVRIIADMSNRITLEAEREGISQKRAQEILEKDDEERKKWSQYLYGIDTSDSSLYDLVIHIHRITVDQAVNIICDTVQTKEFQTTTASQHFLEQLFNLSKIAPVQNLYNIMKLPNH